MSELVASIALAPARLLRSGWRRIRRPSLVRRLMFAQIAMMTLLWSLAVGLLLGSAFTDDLSVIDSTQRSMLVVARNLTDQPARQYESLRAMDIAMRNGFGNGDDVYMSPSVIVWQNGHEVYRSSGLPGGIANTRPDIGETVEADGKSWRARTIESPSGKTRVTLVTPGTVQMWLTFQSRGYYILPLVISIPFLLLPAWLSIRLALRPWRKVANEIASRGPHDLAPVSVLPRHDELRPLVRNFNALMERLRASIAREQSFIADAAHELRTPIAAMRVNVEALQSLLIEHIPTERQDELFARVLSSNARAERLVGQLLRLMRSNAQASAPRALRLDDLVQERLAALSALAYVREVEIELVEDEPVELMGDRDSLVSMIDNLIDNATKYSPVGAVVSVGIRRDGDLAELTVCDQGPGIMPALRERVFDRFFRDPDQTQTGSGLGLAIVRSVVDAHGGAIALGDAGTGPGLRVTVRLPLGPLGSLGIVTPAGS
ncbi:MULTISPECIES: HAMP domain-containing sensor histidine kinase [unclassified Variovorax]|jgi:two-component system sensor histidine kinase QseC|uniref:sensor histidine kinase n=1 Tax=unclassified Variovorax TaxID=663243 RepID=UPI000F7DAECF|nr:MULTISPECIES: HAMP domain-containing sensor histidine kinase [unclassified Variovorax]RSZ30651.1 HAMP domain-containing histidine kinase [Variovorax sp. 553]RSZ31239.1 HAMP domain-containing histidine kinase [Variovorax sp. 679]